jgi:quercetin dioxygenase-like cupin family protein
VEHPRPWPQASIGIRPSGSDECTEARVIKESFHADTESLPWAEGWAGDPRIRLKLLMADIEGQRFAVRMQFAPGLTVAPHKHTGEVHAFTTAGGGTT